MSATGSNREVKGLLSACPLAIAAVRLTTTPAPAQTTWKGGSGNWNDSTKWTSGVPTSSTTALIDGGNAVTSPVTLDIGGAQVLNLTIDSDDSLAFNDSTNLTINGTSISNAGSITLNSGGNPTDLILAGNNTVTLSGAGKLILGNSGNNRVYSAGGSGKLANQETIQGGGQLGVGQMAITNSGTINANVPTTLFVSPNSSGVANTGTLEATGDGGVMESINSATLNGVTISTGSTYTEPDNTTLVGTITNNGTEHFTITYQPTDVLLTVVTGAALAANRGQVNRPSLLRYMASGRESELLSFRLPGRGEAGSLLQASRAVRVGGFQGWGVGAVVSGRSLAGLERGSIRVRAEGGWGRTSLAGPGSRAGVGRQSGLSRIGAMVPAGGVPAGRARPLELSAAGSGIPSLPSSINSAATPMPGNGRMAGVMVPRSLEYQVDVLSFVKMGPRRAWRELWRQSENPYAPALASFTCSGIR